MTFSSFGMPSVWIRMGYLHGRRENEKLKSKKKRKEKEKEKKGRKQKALLV